MMELFTRIVKLHLDICSNLRTLGYLQEIFDLYKYNTNMAPWTTLVQSLLFAICYKTLVFALPQLIFLSFSRFT